MEEVIEESLASKTESYPAITEDFIEIDNAEQIVHRESGHAADRKTMAPMRVRRGKRGLLDAGQRDLVDGLLIDLVVYPGNQRLAAIDDHRHAHRSTRCASGIRSGGVTGEFHDSWLSRSHIHHTLRQPTTLIGGFHAQIGIDRPFDYHRGRVTGEIHLLAPCPGTEMMSVQANLKATKKHVPAGHFIHQRVDPIGEQQAVVRFFTFDLHHLLCTDRCRIRDHRHGGQRGFR